MDDALSLYEFLPVSFRNKDEEKYIQFLQNAFEKNYEIGSFEFAGLAFHLLYMSFFCFSVWQIKLARKVDFDKAMVGFTNDTENHLANATTPFDFYEKVKEATIFRFLKLIGCDNQQVGSYSRFVKNRNRMAHPSGTVFFNDGAELDRYLSEVIKELGNIQGHMTPVLHDLMKDFLLHSYDPETRENIGAGDEITANLIHQNYFSQKDIEACLTFDINSLSGHEHFDDIKLLFDDFVKSYSQN
ncbi:MAG: hypothetical protein IPI58_08685 [Alphaproteobacteria bacterium]|nr:MAG: hypothetical protein IPI58_08685 [Alphaproteobacteria bacterium]